MWVVVNDCHWQNKVSQPQGGLLLNIRDHFVADLCEWWAALGGLAVSCRGESSGNFRPLLRGRAEPGCLYCPPRKLPTLGKGKITDPRSPGQLGKISPKRSPCGQNFARYFLLNFSIKMKTSSQQTRDAVPRNSSSKREKEILECNEFSLCEHV